MKKILISVIIIIILLLCIVSYNKNEFEKIGYNSIELKEIEKLSEDEKNIILKYKYNSNLTYIINSDDYDKEKLDIYLKYTSKYNNIDYLKIFKLINNKDFDHKNIDKYINLLEKHNNIDGIIKYINNSYDIKNINENILEFISQKYFIIDFLDRYLTYFENNSNLSYEEIITRINSNLDYKFYDDSNKTDITKGIYTLVNKYNYLDSNFVPDNLETVSYNYAVNNAKLNNVALENFIKMADIAKQNNINFKITTAYRDYNFQKALYNNYVLVDGIKKADTYSARPGYSEHQLGYSIDLTNDKRVSFDEFEDTEEFKWLKDNAHKYGFILRYPKNKEYITGYTYEPWHYRYVGVDIATYIYKNNITYEEYYAYFLR